MIRAARPEDFGRVERMVRAFDAAAGREIDAPGAGYCPRHFRGVFEHLVAARLGLALLLDTPRGSGVLLAAAAASPFRPALWADEILFWIDPAARGGPGAAALLDAYEDWARDLGASLVGLSAIESRAETLFARRGYVAAERKMMRRI